MSDPKTPSTPSKQTLALTIKDKAILFAAYIQFVNSGGLFIPTQRSFQWGEEVILTVTLMDEPTKYTVNAKVIWLTPMGAQGNRAPGFGLQFLGEEGKILHNKMETYLAGALNSDRPTHTL